MLSVLIDNIFAWIKWPVAVLSVIVLPAACWAFFDLCARFHADVGLYAPLLIGFVGYFLAWQFFLRKPSWGSLLSTFEHELTHAIFAWATLHRVTGFKASWKSGGHIQYRGRGNWLITIAPYFFPTAAVALALVLIWVPAAQLVWVNGALGVTIGYHLTSTHVETHREQTDLKKVGFPFAVMFLPAANVIWYGLVIAFALGGAEAVGGYMVGLVAHTGDLFGGLFGNT